MTQYPQPTFENWYSEVRKGFIRRNKRMSEQEVDRYLSEEGIDQIKSRYKYGREAVEKGEITEGQFWNARVSAVANCLSLCYEGTPEEQQLRKRTKQ